MFLSPNFLSSWKIQPLFLTIGYGHKSIILVSGRCLLNYVPGTTQYIGEVPSQRIISLPEHEMSVQTKSASSKCPRGLSVPTCSPIFMTLPQNNGRRIVQHRNKGRVAPRKPTATCPSQC